MDIEKALFPEANVLQKKGAARFKAQLASSNLKEKVNHLEMSIRAWHDWNEDLPSQVEVICDDVKSRWGQFLNVKSWLIIPPNQFLKNIWLQKLIMVFTYTLIT